MEDTGIGIRREDMDRMFDKFQRINLEKTSTVEGTGLGLAITKKLLDMMGGSISVDSVYGEGSTFTVRLPQQVASARSSARAGPGRRPTMNPSGRRKRGS